MSHSLERDVRILKIYALITTLALAVLSLSAFSSKKVDFDQLTVHRLNVVEADGKPVLVIADRAEMPNAVVNGHELPAKNGRRHGILFYNDEGDEDGGLAFGSTRTPDGHNADAALLFDQYKGDQTIGLMYGEENHQREAALKVWDHPLSIPEFKRKVDAVEAMPPGPRKDAAEKALRQAWGTERVFLGKQEDHSASLVLADSEGHPRIRIAVLPDGSPTLDFLAPDGTVVSHLPARAAPAKK